MRPPPIWRRHWILLRRTVSRILDGLEHYRWQLGLLGNRVTILPECTATSRNRITFGVDVLISHRAFLQGAGGISIGNRVMMGPNVSLITANHDKVTRLTIKKSIFVEDGVWIGAGATILGGVTLGRGSIIAAGALVSRSIPPGSIACGIPARVTGRTSMDPSEQRYFDSENWLNQF